MKTVSVILPKLHPEQRRMVGESRRFNVAVCGRRFGKTTFGVDRLVHPLLNGQPVAWFSPTYKMLAEVWRDFRRVLLPVTAGVDTQQHRIELVTGGVLDMWSLDRPDVARGRKYARVGIDEAGIVRDLLAAWNEVIRPTLVDYRGDAWFFGTPKGLNDFHTLYQRGQDLSQAEWASWQMPTTANPFIDAAEVEAARGELPELTFAQEFLASFIADGPGVFRHVVDCATAALQDKPLDGHVYLIAADWGRHDDFTVLTVIDVTAKCVAWIDRFNQIDFNVQIGRLQALYETFRPQVVIPEYNSFGIPVVETLIRMGMPVVPFTTTNATKQQAIDALALAFERGDIRIPNDPALIQELQAFTAERLPSGLYRYGAPAGMHDDMVMSLAIGWLATADTIQQEGIYLYDERTSISPY